MRRPFPQVTGALFIAETSSRTHPGMATSADTATHQPNAFRFKATGRLWDSDGAAGADPIRLTGKFYGPDDYIRVYVTPEELREDYEPVPA